MQYFSQLPFFSYLKDREMNYGLVVVQLLKLMLSPYFEKDAVCASKKSEICVFLLIFERNAVFSMTFTVESSE